MKYRIATLLVSIAAIAVPAGQGASADPVSSTLPTYNWTGFYVGANVGYGWNGSSTIKNAIYHDDGDYGSYENGWFNGQKTSKSGSFSAGAQVGYNHQFGNSIVGIEADLNYLNAKRGYSAHDFTDLYSGENYNYHLREVMDVKNKTTWLGTVRSRLGFTPVDRLLVYGTGGLAFAQVKSSNKYGWREYGYWWCTPECGQDGDFDRTGGFSGSKSQMRWGWTLGAGAEYVITDRITVKGEYLYVDLGRKRHTIRNPEDGNEFVSWKDATKLQIVRVGLNYKL